ncbi:hypothetical protein Smp_146040 [Schistosoma mansoni]|uniref:Uncharacterized protein n=1 Tax=Schistosoma mansoni TaxID=6183 RepID=G4VQM8_SCHMA|nr:hypothetical protein Smp_146040 [Schistosoma mansoni]|eukprot:XP_018655173.1 hypothetical protein Smp_146040 [Schistosoma mansoni]
MNNLEQNNKEYLDPFNCNTDSSPFSKPSPLECLQKSCNNILKNINPLPYYQILNEVSHKLSSSLNYFANYSSNYSWLKQKRNTKLRHYKSPSSYLFPFPIACSSSKRNLVRSKHTFRNVLHSKKLNSILTNRNIRTNRSIHSKNETLIDDKIAPNDPTKSGKFLSSSNKSITQLTTESPQINDSSTQKLCSTQSVAVSSFNANSSILNGNCTCTICNKIQMFNILLTSWSAVINFIHNLQSNLNLNSNDMSINTTNDFVYNLENLLKQNRPIITESDALNNSFTLPVNSQNDSKDSNLEDDKCDS